MLKLYCSWQQKEQTNGQSKGEDQKEEIGETSGHNFQNRVHTVKPVLCCLVFSLEDVL